MKAIVNSARSFVYGFTLPIRAFRLIFSRKRLLIWSGVPIAMTLALSVWGVAALKAKLVAAGMHWIVARGFAPESLAVQALILFMQILLFVLAAISFSFLAGVIASPFNDILAESAEPYTDPPLSPLKSSVRTLLRTFLIDVLKTVVVTALQIGLLLVGFIAIWIPGLSLIPFGLAFWLLAFQFISYPQTRRGEGLRASIRFLGRNAFATLGFGWAIGLLFAIPIVSSFALPLAVVGGTLLYARFQPR